MIADEHSARRWLDDLPEYDAAARERMTRFVQMLREENEQQNLVSEASLNHVWARHIVDSAQLLLHVPRGTSGLWLDLGTGAGFPGLVVAILRPELSIRLVESRSRRARWLSSAINALVLPFADVSTSPIEKIPTFPAAVVSARAFAPLGKLLELSSRFSTAETLWLLPKGRSAAHELQTLTNWRNTFHVEHSITQDQARIIVGHLDVSTGS